MKSAKEKISWTDDRISLLKRMWKEGKSAAEIAKAVGKGVTRNAVIGKAHRMGLSGRPSPIKKDSAAAPKKAPAAAAPARKPAAAARPVPPAARGLGKPAAPAPAMPARKPPFTREGDEPPKFEKEDVPPGGGVALIDLTERMCKWPIGDPRDADFIFCGLGIRPGTPYCPQHAAAAYQTSSRRVAITTVVNDDKDDPVEAEPDAAEEEAEDEAETAV